MIITATSRNNGIETFPLMCECEMGKDLKEAVAIYGEDFVFAQYKKGHRNMVQSGMRSTFNKVMKECNNDPEKIAEWFKCEDGCFIVDKAGDSNAAKKFASDFSRLSKEEQEERISELKAIYERNENE